MSSGVASFYRPFCPCDMFGSGGSPDSPAPFLVSFFGVSDLFGAAPPLGPSLSGSLSLLALPNGDEGLEESAFCDCCEVLWLVSPLPRCLLSCFDECPYEASLLCLLQLLPLFLWLALSCCYDHLYYLPLMLFRWRLEPLPLLLCQCWYLCCGC